MRLRGGPGRAGGPGGDLTFVPGRRRAAIGSLGGGHEKEVTSSRDAASGAGSNTQARVHYLDTLKAVVVYGIILYHSALAFTWTSWLVSDPRKSLVAVLNLG